MKTKFFNILGALAVMAGMASCHQDVIEPLPSKEVGEVSMRSLSVSVNNAEKVIESRTEIDLSDYIVKIFDARNIKVHEWRYADMPEVFSIAEGNYRALVYSHEVKDAEWEMPYFEGEKEFTVTAGTISEIGTIECKLSNVKVTIIYDEGLYKYMEDDCKVTVSSNSTAHLDYGKDEGRAGYFAAIPGSTTMVTEFNGMVGGHFTTMRRVLTDIAPGQHRIVKYKIKSGNPDKPDETGGIDPSDGIEIDVEVVDEDLTGNVNIEEDTLPGDDRPWGPEDPENPENPDQPDDPTPPTQPTITITSDDVTFDAPNPLKDQVLVKIDSEDGVEHLNVRIITDNANFESAVDEFIPLSFDLAYPGEFDEAFVGFGFPTGAAVIGAKHIDFNISDFVPMLISFPGTHSFQISVTDSKNIQLIKTLTFKVN